MRYSLIIPAWNEANFLPNTLAAISSEIQLLEARSAHRGELIVVDNNSSDNTAAIARSAGATVVFEPINQIARARNRGVTIAVGEALLFLDADSTCNADLLEHALGLLESGTVVGGGSLIEPDRDIGPIPQRTVRFWNWLSETFGLAAGCFIYCRRDAFNDVGGFNDLVFAGEEIYISRRLKRWGKRHGMAFNIIAASPVTTSVRKLDWYSPLQMTFQVLIMLVPGAAYSRRLCRTWYDRTRR